MSQTKFKVIENNSMDKENKNILGNEIDQPNEYPFIFNSTSMSFCCICTINYPVKFPFHKKAVRRIHINFAFLIYMLKKQHWFCTIPTLLWESIQPFFN